MALLAKLPEEAQESVKTLEESIRLPEGTLVRMPGYYSLQSIVLINYY